MELMTLCALLIVGLAFLSVVCQFRWSRQFAGDFRILHRIIPDDDLPRTAVILSLRGSDPDLRRCLKGLLQQHYPNYEVRIVLDSLADPAAHLVNDVLEKSDAKNVSVTVLHHRQRTCSLKVSALLQTIGELDDSFEAIAVLDADAIPYSNWLRDLVTPLKDPAIGAAHGLRWYAPLIQNVGSVVRQLWNMAAVVQMRAYNITWGGSLAIRRDVFRNPLVQERWRVNPVEDASLSASLQALGLKSVLVPTATMVNRESCDLSGCFRFIRRQLLWLWFSHSSATWIMAHSAVSVALLWLAPPLAAMAAATGNMWAAGLAVCGWLVHEVGLASSIAAVRSAPDTLLEQRGEMASRLQFSVWTHSMGMVTQAVYQAALVSMLCLRVIEWRGIRYRFNWSGKFRMIEYHPFQTSQPVSRRVRPRLRASV